MTVIGSANIDQLADALRATARQSGVTTQQVLIQSSGYILAEMEAKVPVDSGRLRESLGVVVSTDKVTIGPDPVKAPYARYVEFGTKPHVIKPKASDGVLSFKLGGRQIYAKSVNHPGTKAQPFVRPAFQAWVESLGSMAAQANVKVLKEAASA